MQTSPYTWRWAVRGAWTRKNKVTPNTTIISTPTVKASRHGPLRPDAQKTERLFLTGTRSPCILQPPPSSRSLLGPDPPVSSNLLPHRVPYWDPIPLYPRTSSLIAYSSPWYLSLSASPLFLSPSSALPLMLANTHRKKRPARVSNIHREREGMSVSVCAYVSESVSETHR